MVVVVVSPGLGSFILYIIFESVKTWLFLFIIRFHSRILRPSFVDAQVLQGTRNRLKPVDIESTGRLAVF